MIVALALLLTLWVLVALVTRYDATGFPREGSEAEQRAFHRKLYAWQTLSFALLYALSYALLGSLLLALLPVASMGVLWACATQDLGYWVWMFILKLKSYTPGQFLGSQPYTKRTSLPVLLFHGGTVPKWKDTTYRLVGLVLYPVPLLILAPLL